ncbi:MAG: LamG-like jellyroll fold domain-containing protein [Candidatus Amoebophilus sp.]
MLFTLAHSIIIILCSILTTSKINKKATVATILISSARTKGRDSRRISDIKQIQTALDLYYANNNSYPTYATPGQAIADSNGTYLNIIPSNPAPYTDGNCPNNDYTYASQSDRSAYTLNFCLGGSSGAAPAGVNVSSSSGIGSAPGLIGWWKLDGNALDSVGSNNGTLNGSPTATTDKSGQENGAYTFNGTDAQNIAITDTGFPIGSNPRTVSLWFQTSTAQTDYKTLFSYGAIGDSYYNHAFLIYVGVPANPDIIKIETYGGAGTAYATSTYYNGAWHHLVITYNSSALIIYYDGGLVVTSTPAALATVLGSVSYVGRSIGLNGGFTGSIDDVRLYNRALSADEVKALYDATK